MGLAFLFWGIPLGPGGKSTRTVSVKKVPIRHFIFLTSVSIDTIILIKRSIDTDIETKWGLWKDHLLKNSMEKLNRPKAQ